VATAKASQLIPCSPSSTLDRVIPPLNEFIRTIVNVTQSLPVTLLSAMILLDRLKSKLPTRACGIAETCHRVFLAALILANKILFDVPIKNQVWSECSSIYSLAEVNLMEKQFLSLLGFQLALTEDSLWYQINSAVMSNVILNHAVMHRASHSSLAAFPFHPLINMGGHSAHLMAGHPSGSYHPNYINTYENIHW